MKFTIFFKSNKEVSGVNTLDAVQSWLYQNFERVNPEKAKWLHDRGHLSENKIMKPLNFSPLYKTSRGLYGIKLSSPDAEVLTMIKQMLIKPSRLIIPNTASLEVVNVKIKRFFPWKYGTVFFTLSPMLLKTRDGFAKLNMEDPDDVEKARQIIEANLAWKYKSLHGKESSDGIDIFIPKKVNPCFHTNYRLNTGQTVPVTGYTGEFLIHGAPELIAMAYYCGIGAKNACGFGCVEVAQSW